MIYTELTCKADSSQVAFIDIQTRLQAVMQSDDMAHVIKNTTILATAAKLLDVPQIITEQYPRGLGHTTPELADVLNHVKPVEKTCFPCTAEPKFNRQLTVDRPQVILAGMEAHICVLQTALGLVASNKQVFIAVDAIISRSPANKANAIARMRDAGCIISNTESIVFEWLGKAEGDAFKTISKLIK